MTAPVIEFREVTKWFPYYHHLQGGLKNFMLRLPSAVRDLRAHRFVALKDVSFQVAPGEAVGVIGHNGAGKSTILGLAAGVMRPNEGEVVVRRRPFPLLELGAGFHPDLDAEQNVLLNGMLLGMPRALVRARLDQIIAFAEVEEFSKQPVRTFSTGMLARLGFSIVTQLDPSLLLIDEVLAVGDIAFQEKCLQVLRGYKEKGCTILFVSHALHQVEAMCDRVLWMEGGRLRMDGSPLEVIEAYEAVTMAPVGAAKSPRPRGHSAVVKRPG